MTLQQAEWLVSGLALVVVASLLKVGTPPWIEGASPAGTISYAGEDAGFGRGSAAYLGGAGPSRVDRAITVVEVEPREIGTECTYPPECVDDYFAFLDQAAGNLGPRLTLFDLQRLLDRPPEPQPTDDLRAAIVDGLHLEFLLDGLDDRDLLVAQTASIPLGSIQQIDLIFEDPLVGVFEATLVLPPGKGPFPALVVHPGRRETAQGWRETNGGLRAASGGVAFLILEPRANAGDSLESTVTRRLLNGGASLVALRVYETLLLRKYLRWRGDVRRDGIGLVASGTAGAVGDLAMRVDPGWAAYVGGESSNYAPPAVGGTLVGETAPAITPLHPWIADLGTAALPTYRLDPSIAGFDPAIDFLWPVFGLETPPGTVFAP